ncbi:MAG TPA: helix-turn-helix domain-containing protein [Bryobacteraceae bacterium]|jgi:cytoskeletal protein RodZ
MQSVGTWLRQARIAQGQTLEGISAATRITLKNLSAIEADELTKLSSPFIYRSFVRQYAEALKLDYAARAADVRAASHSIPEPLIPGQASIVPVHTGTVIPPHVPRDFRWMYPVAALILVVVACSSLYGLYQHPPVERHRRISPVVLAAQRPLQTATPLPRRPQPPPAPLAAAKPESPIHLELSAIEPTWLSLTSDGKPTYKGILETSATTTLDSYDRARIQLGNAGGVNVLFNGKALGALGKRGQVRTIEFTTAGYREIALPPRAAAQPQPAAVNPSGE